MSCLGGKERFQPYKIAAYIPAKRLPRPDRAPGALTGLTRPSLTWGPRTLCPWALVSAGAVLHVYLLPAVVQLWACLDMDPAWTHPGLCPTLVPLTGPDLEPHSHTAGLAWPQPIPVLVPREAHSAWGWGYPAAHPSPNPAPDWGWDRPGWEASALLPPQGPPAAPGPLAAAGPCGTLPSLAFSSPKPASQSQAHGFARTCPTNLAWL